MTQSWGKFTVLGGEAVERQIGQLVGQVAEIVGAVVPPSEYRALILLGGYGRGEGGIEVIDGKERPHNNLDFLLITTRRASRPALTRDLNARLRPVAEQHGIGLDLSVVSLWQLRTAPPLVLWCDMRFGHKTILGDPALVPSLRRFEIGRILPADVRNLTVNRGTLLLINEQLLERGALSLDERKTIIRHAVKATIGYGDALLFHQGAYHWSYLEKQRRMQAQADIPERLRTLYEEAMQFRCRAAYGPFLGRDLAGWMTELRELLGPIHLRCEAARLRQPDLRWDNYLEIALARALGESPFSPRAWLRKARNFFQSPPPVGAAPWPVRIGWRCCGWRGLLPLFFPVIAFRLDHPRPLAWTRSLLNAPEGGFAALRATYLEQWGRCYEVNFRFGRRAAPAEPRPTESL